MNNFNLVTAKEYWDLIKDDHKRSQFHSLADVEKRAKSKTRDCYVCKQSPAWKLAGTGMCFSCVIRCKRGLRISMKNAAAQALRAIKSEKRSEASRQNGMLGGTHKPCEKCQSRRFKTRIKGKEWECRNCGNVRVRE